MLQTFCFDAIELEMEDGCLPASLRTLCMTWQHYKPLPAAIAHATQLRNLALWEWWGADLRCIERLAQLTYLGLSATAGDHDDPPPALRLSAFPALQCLVLRGRYQPYPVSLEGASSALQQLTYLNLRGVTPGSQPNLCAGLSMLTNLQVCWHAPATARKAKAAALPRIAPASSGLTNARPGLPPTPASLQIVGNEWSSPSILTPAALAGMRQLRAASLHVQTAVTAAAVLRALPRLELLFLHLRCNDDAHAGNGQAAKPAPADLAALLDQLAVFPAMKGLHLDGAVHTLLKDEKQQQLFQPALAKLAAAGIHVTPPAPWWRRREHDLWQAAAQIPAEPDGELLKLLQC